MKHITNAYKDGFKWVIYCTVCGIEEPVLNVNGDCPGEYQKKYQAELFTSANPTKSSCGQLSKPKK